MATITSISESTLGGLTAYGHAPSDWINSASDVNLYRFNADNRITWRPSVSRLEVYIGGVRVAWFEIDTPGTCGVLRIAGQAYEDYSLGAIGETQPGVVEFDRAAGIIRIGAFDTTTDGFVTALEFHDNGNIAVYEVIEDGTTVPTVPASLFDGEIDLDSDGTLTVSELYESLTLSMSAELGGIDVDGDAKRDLPASGAPELGAMTASGDAARTRNASGAVSLGALTADGSGAHEFPATGAASLGAVAASGAGTRLIKPSMVVASSAASMGSLTASGEASRSAHLRGRLGAIDPSGAVVVSRFAAGVPEMAALSAAVSVAVERQASGTPSLAALAASGASAMTRSATGAADLGALAIDATAARDVTTAGAVSLGALEVAGAAKKGTGLSVRHASGAPALGSLAAAGAASRAAHYILRLGGIEADGSATREVTTSGSVSLAALMVAIDVDRDVSASGSPTLGAFAAGAVANRSGDTTGAVDLPAMTADGSGVREVIASEGPTLGTIAVDGAALRDALISAAVTLPGIAADGAIVRLLEELSIALDLPALTVHMRAENESLRQVQYYRVVSIERSSGAAKIARLEAVKKPLSR